MPPVSRVPDELFRLNNRISDLMAGIGWQRKEERVDSRRGGVQCDCLVTLRVNRRLCR